MGVFEAGADAGSRILIAIVGKDLQRGDKTYIDLIGRVFKTLSDIHDMLLDFAIAVGGAASLDEAKELVNSLDLRKILKFHSYCDKLMSLGDNIRPRIEKRDLPQQDKIDILSVTSAFEEAERGTALLYDGVINKFRDLVYDATSLDTLRERFDEVCSDLAKQKAAFDLLYKKAQGKRKHLY